MLRLQTGSEGGLWRFLLLTTFLWVMLPSLSFCQDPTQQRPSGASGEAESGNDGNSAVKTFAGIAAIIAAVGTSIAAIISARSSNKKATESTKQVKDIDQQIQEFKRDLNNQLVTPAVIKIIKNQGRFLDDQDLTTLGRIFRDLMMQEENLKVIRLHGNFADQEAFSRLGKKLKGHSERLQEAEQNLLDLDEIVERLKVTIDLQEEREKWEEEVRKRFPQLKPEGGN